MALEPEDIKAIIEGVTSQTQHSELTTSVARMEGKIDGMQSGIDRNHEETQELFKQMKEVEEKISDEEIDRANEKGKMSVWNKVGMFILGAWNIILSYILSNKLKGE